MHTARLASELLRNLRGKRSQTALARRLGVGTHALANWEHGRRWPTAARALWVAERVGVDVEQAFRQFYRQEPEWLNEHLPTSREGVASFLDDLRGNTRIAELSRLTGKSRFCITRWLKGTTEPKLPDFLTMIEACSLRLLDFLATLVDPRRLPSAREAWRQLEQARTLAYDAPWTSAVLHALETDGYRRLAQHRPGYLAKRLGIARSEEERCLRLLTQSGRIHWVGRHFKPREVGVTDTRTDPERARDLRVFWAREGARRAEQGEPGLKYNLCGISERDLRRLRTLQASYLSEMRTLIAQSEPVERVVLITDGICDLTHGS